MKRQFMVFLIRWLLNSVGIWMAVRIFGTGHAVAASDQTFGMFLLAGLIFSLVNAVLKPLAVIFALPAILVTLGLFTIVVNGLMVYISLKMTPGTELTMTFWRSILTGLLLSLINYIVSGVLDRNYARFQEEK